ncbi:hypothetical protein ONS96_012722 [Cadophora gregata f. sp. sojae]|nr:hypothetical protein ONS96_012722 [Cadophora gregata f. sp. sojae]
MFFRPKHELPSSVWISVHIKAPVYTNFALHPEDMRLLPEHCGVLDDQITAFLGRYGKKWNFVGGTGCLSWKHLSFLTVMGMTSSGTGAGALGINFGGCFRAYHETAHGSGNFSCAFRNLALAFFSATLILFCRNFAFISAASIISCFEGPARCLRSATSRSSSMVSASPDFRLGDGCYCCRVDLLPEKIPLVEKTL